MEPPNTPSSEPYARPPWYQDRLTVTLVAAVAVFAIVAVTLLLIVLNARGGEGATASATPSASAQASSVPSASASASDPGSSSSPTSTASASASASPTAVPQAELPQGWAKITTAMNLRDGAIESSAIITRLQPREVVWIGSEPNINGENNWYYVITLKQEAGWIAGGPADDPYATALSNQYVFKTCGAVAISGNYGLVNGLRTTRRMDEVASAAFELAIATDTHACVRYWMDDFQPNSKLSLDINACGAPAWDGSVMRLHPTTAGTVDDAWRVDATTVVPPALLTFSQSPDGDGLTNHQKMLILGSRLSSPFACASVKLVNQRTRITTEVTGCLTVISQDSELYTLAAADGDSVTLMREYGQLADVPLNDPNILRVSNSYLKLKSELVGDC